MNESDSTIQTSDLRHTKRICLSLGNVTLLCLTIVVSGGATCIRRAPTVDFPPPVIFQSVPDATQIVSQLNKSQNINQLQTSAVSVSMPGVPNLNASLFFEKPANFRLRGGAPLIGEVLDIGSNSEAFWLATRQGPSPTLLVAQHNQFMATQQRQILPVSPLWLVEAIGLVQIDPFTSPLPINQRADRMLELSSFTPEYGQGYSRTLIIDPTSGVIRQVLLRDASGALIATSTLERHEYYAGVDYSLPGKVIIQLLPKLGEPIEFTINFGPFGVNQPDSSGGANWILPDTRGYNVQDLSQITIPTTAAFSSQ